MTTRSSTKDIRDGERTFQQAAEQFTEAQLMCRSMRHNWVKRPRGNMQVTVPEGKNMAPYATLVWVCSRTCGVERHDRIYLRERNDGTFAVVDRETGRYVYPEGYQIPGVPRGVKPSTILWQEYVRRNNEVIAGALKGEREREK